MAMAACTVAVATSSIVLSGQSSSRTSENRHAICLLSSSLTGHSARLSSSFSSISSSLWFVVPSQHPGCKRKATWRFCRMMLPSQFSGDVSNSYRQKWSARAIKSFSMAELEARKLKYPTTGTEAVLMGILTEGTSQAARYLRANKITLFGVRDETVKLLGKADMYFFSPEHPPLTEPAQKALDWAVEAKKKTGGDGEVTASHLLLGIWAQKGSAGQQVLAALGFDDKKAKELEEMLGRTLQLV